jgi:probable F420-dependent oxidoreductase
VTITDPDGPPAEPLQVVTPFWLDRPDAEAVEIAITAERHRFSTLWIGEMATFDAFALATAVGLRAPRLRLTVGPLAAGVRSPVALALGVSSVAGLTGSRVDLAIGASSPEIVIGWHDRAWAAPVERVQETVEATRALLAGERVDYAGAQVRTRGFRLRTPQPQASITIAAFGPRMTGLAGQIANQVVLNLVSPARVADARAALDLQAARTGRPPPRLVVWVAVALDPGPPTRCQLAGQLAAYLRPPGYGELFADLGYGPLVDRARAGATRAELVESIPVELIAEVCAIGSAAQIDARLGEYFQAGADHVAIVPATAEDPAAQRVLEALAPGRPDELVPAPRQFPGRLS